ncbi:hypothetical protein IGI04_019081 [Brassica rapa subsp. trilocularis]|uniref:Uncharacterized protein n=1 Tax=Brassica rapa subsp. trilocularis TaxID=1813537 RepID=A0ABQ7MET6_BRACM|nr:hypothetical protein IGI04_019081 [Brassica rapa subsp. trilocularis]
MTNENDTPTPMDTSDVIQTPLNAAATGVTTAGNITASTTAATTSTFLPAGNAADETTRRTLFGAGLYQTAQRKREFPTRAPPPPSGRLGAWAWDWVEGLWPDKNYSFWTKLSSKNSIQFYLKRQVVCLENKNVMHVILSKVLNEIRESLEEEVSELKFPRSPRDSRPRAAAVAGSGSSPSL